MIIAEVGQNHCGDMSLAKRLIGLAKENGGDLCKFQLYNHNLLYKDHPEIPDVALSFEQAKMLFDYGEEIGIEVFFSVFDVERVDWCEKIGVKRYKIASSVYKSYKIYNDDSIISAVAQTNKEIIASVPYGDLIGLPIISQTYQLYCIPEYPASFSNLCFESVDFRNLDGFSDHTIGIDAAKIALARGASIIEKHFAIDHQAGIDALWSMAPDELKELKRWELVCKEIL